MKRLLIFVRRFRCRYCRKTVSVLPGFAQAYVAALNEHPWIAAWRAEADAEAPLDESAAIEAA